MFFEMRFDLGTLDSGLKMYFCRWLSFLKMQFCGYPSFRWDLMGCLDLNTKKNEKKNVFQFFKRGVSRKKRVMWVVGLIDLTGGGPKK